MSTMSNQLSIQDLPVECVDEVLKRISKVADRNHARLVCKLWRDLLNRDSSFERYRITKSTMKKNSTILCNPLPHPAHKDYYFHYLIPLFLTFRRKKISIYFENVDLESSEKFWTLKGTEVAHLYFGYGCIDIPLIQIIEHCPRLRSLTFDRTDSEFKKCIQELREKRITDESSVTNLSVDSLNFYCANLKDVTDIVQTFIASFPRAKNILFDYLKGCDKDINWPAYLNSLRDSFKDLKSVIKLSTCSRSGNTFVIDSRLSNVPLKVTSLSVNVQLDNGHLPLHHFSHFPCRGKYLEGLFFGLSLKPHQSWKLDQVEEIVSRWPLLTSFGISTFYYDICNITPLTNRLSNNNIKYLKMSFCKINCSFVNNYFLQSFVHLKSITCNTLVYSDFVKLVNHLECLEEFDIQTILVDVNAELDHDLKGITTVSNIKLKKLQIPQSVFSLSPAMKYEFNNLKKLTITCTLSKDKQLLFLKGMDNHLKRIDCPKIESLNIYTPFFDCELNQEKKEQMIMNIASHFPTLNLFLTPFSKPISDHFMEMMRQNYPGLQDIYLRKVSKPRFKRFHLNIRI